MTERTVDDVAEIILSKMPELQIPQEDCRKLMEVHYTLEQAGLMERMHEQDIFRVWRMVELVRQGLFSEEMRV